MKSLRHSLVLLFVLATRSAFAVITPAEIEEIKLGLRNKVVFFTGYPGSGKGTQGKILSDLLGIIHLSTGEFFRAQAESGSELGSQMKPYMIRGEIIPSHLTFALLDREINPVLPVLPVSKEEKSYRNGFILDGYPKNEECFEFITQLLAKKGIDILSVIHFDISREQANSRLEQRLHCRKCEKSYKPTDFNHLSSFEYAECCGQRLGVRDDDQPESIERRLNTYEKNNAPLFPKYQKLGVLRTIAVPDQPNEMTEIILQTLQNDVRASAELKGVSYYPRPLLAGEIEKSSIFHNHLDAQNHALVYSMIQKINGLVPESQSKLYPISDLILGPQISDLVFKDVYQNLPNFHPIQHPSYPVHEIHEAFATGKMGDSGIDYDQVKTTLEVAFAHPGQGVMTEIEEELLAFTTQGAVQSATQDLILIETLNRGDSAYHVQWDRLAGWQERMISHVPQYELHHGFDIPKKIGELKPPIELTNLMEQTSRAGLITGGWFIFAKDDRWSYRSNEFSNEDFTSCSEKLKLQSRALWQIVHAFTEASSPIAISSSLEKIHAIWQVH